MNVHNELLKHIEDLEEKKWQEINKKMERELVNAWLVGGVLSMAIGMAIVSYFFG